MSSQRPLLLLQGGPGLGLEYFAPPMEFLNQSHHVYKFEYKGRTLNDIFSFLRRDLDKAAIQGSLDVVAHSWGSFVLFKLMRDHGLSNLRHVVFVTPTPSSMVGLMAAIERLQNMIPAQLSPSGVERLQALESDGNGPQDQEKIRLLKPCYVADPRHVDRLRFENYDSQIHAGVFAEMAGYNYGAELASLAGRFSLITGEKDFIQLDELGDFSKHAATAVQLPNVGHSPFVEQPEVFADLVRHLLR